MVAGIAVILNGMNNFPARFTQRLEMVARLGCSFLWLLALTGLTIHKACAQEPGGHQLPPASFQTTVAQGIVVQFLMNPDGFVDGLLLSNNTIIRFPPHLGQVLTQTVSPQDSVRVEGFFESPGILHASSIIDLQSQRSIVDTPPSPSHPHPPRPGSVPRQQLSASGAIRINPWQTRRDQWCGALRWDSRTLSSACRNAICHFVARRKRSCSNWLRNKQ
jgi:hypothetical protein